MITYYEGLLEKAYKWVKIKWKNQRGLRESGLHSPSTHLSLQMSKQSLRSNTKLTIEQIQGDLGI